MLYSPSIIFLLCVISCFLLLHCHAIRKSHNDGSADESRVQQRTRWSRTRIGAANRKYDRGRGYDDDAAEMTHRRTSDNAADESRVQQRTRGSRTGIGAGNRKYGRGRGYYDDAAEMTHRRTSDNASVVFHYFRNLSSNQIDLFNQLGELYNSWNQKLNLISRKDIGNLYSHHVLHSLSISRIVSFTSGSKILDFGSGGGLPGIPLAILLPDVSFHLVDSVAKKVRVMEEIVSSLGLTNVICTCKRGEDIEEKYDFILGRAVVKLPLMYDFVKDKFSAEQKNNFSNGLLYLTGKSEDRVPCTLQWYPISTVFKESYFAEKYLVHAYPTDQVNNSCS